MIRKVSIVKLEGTLVLIGKYGGSAPECDLLFDAASHDLIPKRCLKSLSFEYISNYIFSILGRSGTLNSSNLLRNQEFNKIPEYDLSSYPIGPDLELEFDGYVLIQDNELAENKDKLEKILDSAQTSEEILEKIKEEFNLESSVTESEIPEVVTPSGLRPRDINSVVKLINPYLEDISNVKGNCVEFSLLNPITDFILDGSDTELMTEIRSTYASWDSIEVSEVKSESVRYPNVFPISDPNLYLKIGQDYVKSIPEDILISSNGSYYNLFESGPSVPRFVVVSGDTQIDLSLDNLRMINYEGKLEQLSGVSFKSKSLGKVSSSLYCKVDDEYQEIQELSSSLAMFSIEVTQSSGTTFRFYFK